MHQPKSYIKQRLKALSEISLVKISLFHFHCELVEAAGEYSSIFNLAKEIADAVWAVSESTVLLL